MTLEEMFSIVDAIEPDADGCKIWPLGLIAGYGQVHIPDGGSNKAHRRVLVRKLGREIQDGLCACHTCDVPSCVNEDHLWEGTHADNAADRERKGRRVQVSGSDHGMFGKGYLIAGERHPMFGLKGALNPNFGRKTPSSSKSGDSNPMFGKTGPLHPKFGKKYPKSGVANSQFYLQRRTIYWGA